MTDDTKDTMMSTWHELSGRLQLLASKLEPIPDAIDRLIRSDSERNATIAVMQSKFDALTANHDKLEAQVKADKDALTNTVRWSTTTLIAVIVVAVSLISFAMQRLDRYQSDLARVERSNVSAEIQRR